MQPIDLKIVLEEATSLEYSDLVTRRTGQIVRTHVEAMLDDDDERVTVIDFTSVRLLDLSCADEIVAKLVLTHGRARYFLFRGVHAAHRDAIDPVLERQGLAAVAQDRDGHLQLIGSVPHEVRQVFDFVTRQGGAHLDDIAQHLAVPADAAHEVFSELLDRRLARPGTEHRVIPIA